MVKKAYLNGTEGVLFFGEAIIEVMPGCQDKCGNITIPYPFGIGKSCSIDSWSELRCDSTFNPPKLFFTHSSISGEIAELSSHPTKPIIRIKKNISTICFDGSGAIISRHDSFVDVYKNTPFILSPTGNLFAVIGCGMYGIFKSASEFGEFVDLTRGCMTLCDKVGNSDEGKCLGSGCCQMELPLEATPYNINVDTLNVSGVTTNITSNRCGSAFLADPTYNFKASDIESLKVTTVMLEFAIGNQTCREATACMENSYCHANIGVGLLHGKQSQILNSAGGYYCVCNPGYEGNPYLQSGCQDIDECDNPNRNTCGQSICFNTQGSYICKRESKTNSARLLIPIIGTLLILVILGGSIWVHYIKRKQLQKLSEKLTRLDARLLLIQEICSQTKIFTAKKLEQATNNFHQSRILGQGGYGTVYKGILPDQSIVAVKKSRITEKIQFDEFINEVAILTKINHRNIVKLLGCSVETEHPLLVYEFVSNGTLSDHIFKKDFKPYTSMTWENRLRIAAETAGALAYLHSAASIPIIHRDVKPSNILLDDNFTAKVADFGVSRVNHLDQTEISTLVKGTVGYLDPEYMQTSQLTEKSDVFSFGVVLAELLTGKKSISFERAQGERNLAIYFSMSMSEERLLHIVEEGMVNADNIKQVQVVAAIVQSCVNFKGEERPSMKEVASKLEALRGFSKKHPSSEQNNGESSNFTSNQVNIYPTNIYGDKASGSLAPELTMSLTVPR